jgi:uncharacterized protein
MKPQRPPSEMNPRSPIDPYVQKMIAGTNGNMYVDLIDRLECYPIPELPLREPGKGIFLDIGCGWGRWMVGAARHGFTPIGIDIKLEAALAAKKVLADCGFTGHVVVADLQSLPFQSESIDFVWSYSVIQHVHRKYACACLRDIARVLQPAGKCLIEFPMRGGLWNRHQAARYSKEEDDLDSWCVRYYSITELRRLFLETFGNFSYENHCFFGIGIQPVDLRCVSAKYKPVILASLFLSGASRFFPPLKRLSDSVYVSAAKMQKSAGAAGEVSGATLSSEAFLKLLCCPVTRSPLSLDPGCQRLICKSTGMAYPIRKGVPVLLPHEARPL